MIANCKFWSIENQENLATLRFLVCWGEIDRFCVIPVVFVILFSFWYWSKRFRVKEQVIFLMNFCHSKTSSAQISLNFPVIKGNCCLWNVDVKSERIWFWMRATTFLSVRINGMQFVHCLILASWASELQFVLSYTCFMSFIWYLWDYGASHCWNILSWLYHELQFVPCYVGRMENVYDASWTFRLMSAISLV